MHYYSVTLCTLIYTPTYRSPRCHPSKWTSLVESRRPDKRNRCGDKRWEVSPSLRHFATLVATSSSFSFQIRAHIVTTPSLPPYLPPPSAFSVILLIATTQYSRYVHFPQRHHVVVGLWTSPDPPLFSSLLLLYNTCLLLLSHTTFCQIKLQHSHAFKTASVFFDFAF